MRLLAAFTCVCLLSVAAASAHTDTEAVRGTRVYVQHGIMCHGANGARGAVPSPFRGLRGPYAPVLIGRGGLSYFHTAGYLPASVGSDMPAQAPGSLTQEEYREVAAHILQANGLKPDGRALTRDLTRDLILERANQIRLPVGGRG